MRDVIATKEGPQAIGPYSQAIRANGFVFVSGQVAIDPSNQQVISGDVAAQTERVLKNMGDFTAMNEVYGRYFNVAPPARSTVEVARLPKDVLVEIDVIAMA